VPRSSALFRDARPSKKWAGAFSHCGVIEVGAMKTTFFGLTKFQNSMALQDQAYRLVENSGFPVVMGFEYYPVVTLGKRAEGGLELQIHSEQLREKGIDVVETDRGGLATLHSPGQLVIYPLVPIQKLGISVRDFVSCLEETTVQWLQKYRILAHRDEEAGVFTGNGKIAFIGIRVERGITRHGISINISNNLNMFSVIRSCGVSERALDSLEKQNIHLELAPAFEEWNQYFTANLLKLVPNP
jgi:lipoyl(octanoyl) transferase